MAFAIFFAAVPNPDTVGPQVGGVSPVQARHPESGGQVHRLLEGKDHMLVPGVIGAGRPVCTVVPINHILRIKWGAGRIGRGMIIARVTQNDAGNLGVIQNPLGGYALRAAEVG